MSWVLYTVTSEDRVIDGSLQRFANSVLETGATITAVIGVRGGDESLLSRVRETFHPGSSPMVIELPHEVSLSQARNRLLQFYPPRIGDLCAFPDDDCWYPPNLLSAAALLLGGDWDFVCGVVDTDGTESRVGVSMSTPMDVEQAIRRTASAAIFLRAECLSGFWFEPLLGIGGKYRAGEDIDLALYCLRQGLSGSFSPDLRVGHPKRTKTDSYFPGSIAAMRRNQEPANLWPICRRLIHGSIMVLTGHISVRSLNLAGEALFERGWQSERRPQVIMAERIRSFLDSGRPRSVTWYNHYSIQASLRSRVDLASFDLVGVDGLLLARLVKYRDRTSADLVLPCLFERSNPVVGLVGGAPQEAEANRSEIAARFPRVSIAWSLPGYGGSLYESISQHLMESPVDLIVLGLGAPLQDEIAISLKAFAEANGLHTVVVTCGGWLDQIKQRTYYPRWAYPLRLNWLVRLAKEPRRLWRRYSIEAVRAYAKRGSIAVELRKSSLGPSRVTKIHSAPLTP